MTVYGVSHSIQEIMHCYSPVLQLIRPPGNPHLREILVNIKPMPPICHPIVNNQRQNSTPRRKSPIGDILSARSTETCHFCSVGIGSELGVDVGHHGVYVGVVDHEGGCAVQAFDSAESGHGGLVTQEFNGLAPDGRALSRHAGVIGVRAVLIGQALWVESVKLLPYELCVLGGLRPRQIEFFKGRLGQPLPIRKILRFHGPIERHSPNIRFLQFKSLGYSLINPINHNLVLEDNRLSVSFIAPFVGESTQVVPYGVPHHPLSYFGVAAWGIHAWDSGGGLGEGLGEVGG